MKKRTVLLIGRYTKEECNLSMYKQNFFVYKIDELMVSKNYERIFRKLTSFDAWYVSKEALKN